MLARVAPFAHTVEESGTALAELATGSDFTGRYVEVRRVEASSDESYDPHRARSLGRRQRLPQPDLTSIPTRQPGRVAGSSGR